MVRLSCALIAREADEFKKLMSSLADFTPKEWERKADWAGDRAFLIVAGTGLRCPWYEEGVDDHDDDDTRGVYRCDS